VSYVPELKRVANNHTREVIRATADEKEYQISMLEKLHQFSWKKHLSIAAVKKQR
jgi:hypothetical protein